MANILIVDDSILMRRNLRLLLQQAGHTVVAEASDGMEGYREYARHKPDLVTMDITMPVLSGIDAVKKIMATYPDARIIMISALDQRSMIFEAIQNGAKHYILKPITMEKIVSVINEVLQEPSQTAVTEALEAESKREAGSGGQSEPFRIENKSGVFVVTLTSQLKEESLAQLATAIQGFLFIKPLKVVFHFGQMNRLEPEAAEALSGFMEQIASASGSVRLVSADKAMMQLLKERFSEVSGGRIYSDLAQVII